MENGTLLNNKNLLEVNPLVFAYIGDAIYEVFIREQNVVNTLANVSSRDKLIDLIYFGGKND